MRASGRIVKPYIEDLMEHGTNVLHTPSVYSPTDGVASNSSFGHPPGWGQVEFDWSQVKRWGFGSDVGWSI